MTATETKQVSFSPLLKIIARRVYLFTFIAPAVSVQ
uniref:Uncharacterized protein n=1 Tax=Anguilla anguilla TaxID=7936 RepID=A0A0E9QCA5_ANGAN